MKTICPHCNQEYDVENEWRNMELGCAVCNKNFIAVPSDICQSCGSANLPGSTVCRNCRQTISIAQESPVQQVTPVQRTSSFMQVDPRQIYPQVVPDCPKTTMWQKIIIGIKNFFRSLYRKKFEVEIFCPQCHQKYELPKSVLFTKVTCSVCNQEFTAKELRICPQCHNLTPPESGECVHCKLYLDDKMMTAQEKRKPCPKCGTMNLPYRDSCIKCGEYFSVKPEHTIHHAFFWPLAIFLYLWIFTPVFGILHAPALPPSLESFLNDLMRLPIGLILLLPVIYYAVIGAGIFLCKKSNEIMTAQVLQWPFRILLCLSGAFVGIPILNYDDLDSYFASFLWLIFSIPWFYFLHVVNPNAEGSFKTGCITFLGLVICVAIIAKLLNK